MEQYLHSQTCNNADCNHTISFYYPEFPIVKESYQFKCPKCETSHALPGVAAMVVEQLPTSAIPAYRI